MLDPQLQSLLQSLRTRIRRYVILDSVLAIAAVVLSAFWIGLLIDYLPVTLGGSEMPRSARCVLLLGVGLFVLFLFARLLLSRLSRPLPDDSLALLVERHHPQLGGRLVTAVQLTRPGRTNDSHSEDLLQRVHREAAESIDQVDPARVFRPQPLIRKAAVAVPLLLMVIVFAFYSPSAFARAAARLTLISDDRWPRRARLEMVGVDLPAVSASSVQDPDPVRVEFAENVVRLPMGSSPTLRIRAAADDAVVPTLCTVYYETDDGTRGQSNMRRVGRERDGYQAFVLDGPPLSNLTDSFTFSIQGLDDRLSDFRIEAVEPPTLSQMNVRVRYPDYLRNASVAGDGTDEYDFETAYQAGLRISEGSRVMLNAESSLPLGRVDAVVEYDGTEKVIDNLVISEDRSSLQIELDQFRSPTAIRLVPEDDTGIQAQAPFRYFLGAVLDEPPTVSLKINGIQSAVTPIALLPIECEVQDDYGTESLYSYVARAMESDTESDARPDAEPPLGIPMNPDRDGHSETEIDLRELTNSGRIAPLQPGGAISVYAEARDGFDLDGIHQTTSEIFRLQVVTPEELLSLLERRELGLRTRLEQTVTETKGLRDQLARFRADGFEVSAGEPQDTGDADDSEQERSRELQILRLRVQQSGLQASKTTEELNGIAESLDDLLLEMVNNRVDSKDRQERLGGGVRDPLRKTVQTSMARLNEQLKTLESLVETPEEAARQTELAIQTADQVLLELSTVLEKMLDLESYNELLDMVRGLIEDQKKLKEETQEERKNRVKDLFKL